MRKPKPLDPILFRCAVRTWAMQCAKNKVKEQLRAEGLKVSHYSCREISEKAEVYFEAHWEELIARAIADVWRFPMFARYRQQHVQP